MGGLFGDSVRHGGSGAGGTVTVAVRRGCALACTAAGFEGMGRALGAAEADGLFSDLLHACHVPKFLDDPVDLVAVVEGRLGVGEKVAHEGGDRCRCSVYALAGEVSQQP